MSINVRSIAAKSLTLGAAAVLAAGVSVGFAGPALAAPDTPVLPPSSSIAPDPSPMITPTPTPTPTSTPSATAPVTKPILVQAPATSEASKAAPVVAPPAQTTAETSQASVQATDTASSDSPTDSPTYSTYTPPPSSAEANVGSTPSASVADLVAAHVNSESNQGGMSFTTILLGMALIVILAGGGVGVYALNRSSRRSH